jgi:glycosyltransferase involved in cell wall biosynthesis
MKYSKTVCICIPCYNNEKTIYDTLDSIVNQSYKNIVIKVFDNASTDKSLDIVSHFIEKGYDIKIYRNIENTSGEQNFNRCIQHAEGEYTAIFHSDDVYKKNIIEEQVLFMNKFKSRCVAVSTHADIIDVLGFCKGERFIPKELTKKKYSILDRKVFTDIIFKYGNFITCPSVLFKTSTLKYDIVRFRGDSFKSSSDLDVWFRLTEFGEIGFLNAPLMNYRLSDASFSYNLTKIRIKDHDYFLVLNDFLKKYQGDSETLRKNYNILLMKDRVKTNFNKMKLGRNDFESFQLVFDRKRIFESREYISIYIYAVLCKIFIILPFRKKISTFFCNILKKINHE